MAYQKGPSSARVGYKIIRADCVQLIGLSAGFEYGSAELVIIMESELV